MRKIITCALLLALVSCKGKNDNIPDVSDISVDIKLERFERDFFSIDTNNIEPGLDQLFSKYPVLAPVFMQEILGLDSISVLPGVTRFIQLSQPVYKASNAVIGNGEQLRAQFEKAFRFVKYYFPQYKLPSIVTVLGPLDALAQIGNTKTPDFLGPDFLGISLQFYLGKDFEAYRDPYFIENVAPAYRSRRFSKEYIIGDAMLLIVDDLFPDKSSSKPLLEQMVEKGKQWYLLDKFLPTTHDSIKTGYTKAQLEWCESNEGLIWNYITKNEKLDALDMPTLQTYIGEGPFTQGFSQEYSPGNLGQWIGWRIVEEYAEKNSGLHPQKIMETPARTILDEAKYKPK